MKVGRNDTCPCGSGLKHKKCCQGKKTRSLSLSVQVDGGNSINSIAINTLTGHVQFLNNGKVVTPANASVELTIPRAKGNKVIAKSDLPTSALNMNTDSILRNHDIFFAVDTNSRTVDDLPMSVTGVVLGRRDPTLEFANAVPFQFQAVHAIEFWGAEHDQERIGWIECIEALLRNVQRKDHWKVCLVVDAHLGNLAAINSRKEPILGDQYLPDNFSIVYASADKKNDSVLNQMLAHADMHAKKVMAELLQNRSYENFIKGDGKRFRCIRHHKVED